MVDTSNNGNLQEDSIMQAEYDRRSEVEAFEDSKAGVKGLFDSGLTKIPRIFLNKHSILEKNSAANAATPQFVIPVIDFEGLGGNRRVEIVNMIKDACENWGFFQVINHGIPDNVMDKMLEGIRHFHEQDFEAKKPFHSRDVKKKVTYNSNFDLLVAPTANWRDSLYCVMAPNPPKPEEFPHICRDIMIKYAEHVMSLGYTLFELLSEALGLDPDHLKGMGCSEGLFIIGHYYPPCPEPDLTLGFSSHTDSGFLGIVLQDQLGGLQVLHQDVWVDVPFLPGSLIVNIGDMLQLLTNDKFKSVHHRVLAKQIGPRISVASFFRMHFQEDSDSKSYGPIKELLSEEKSAIYRETNMDEVLMVRYNKGLDGSSLLSHFKL
ncbi:PREDICTED: 1-aminocyclopropane-1-carboxylate oxidase homolog 1-like isoform X2 [Ipomoea nil]|uniref:1-aminocyclopropane-1-carboxylate oxidase homolog 1-like isoform X2 n=1 Tax=Ipomoea nil TaxID=35883 RepID=UPI0009015C33|nr:PREDICTED: 1-aminocyclopropane-1-carboxylate oxidase homolog 1-like isoform X2 [Ipomoea nil]